MPWAVDFSAGNWTAANGEGKKQIRMTPQQQYIEGNNELSKSIG